MSYFPLINWNKKNQWLQVSARKLLGDQVTSKYQMDILDKSCKPKTEKVDTTIESCIFELV